jgi:hypothetical protein
MAFGALDDDSAGIPIRMLSRTGTKMKYQKLEMNIYL